MITNDYLLYRLQKHIRKTAKLVTDKPVFVRVSGHIRPKTGDAILISYPNIKSAKEYEVVYRRQFYEQTRNRPRKLEMIASHELAHIKYPNRHTEAFRKEARRLGAGRYARSHID